MVLILFEAMKYESGTLPVLEMTGSKFVLECQ